MESCSGQSWPQMISIHALREEGDASPVQPLRMVGNFYPRPPRGGRHHAACKSGSCRTISIHALREEGDPLSGDHRERRRGFLSTPSARRATSRSGPTSGREKYFYPRPPRGGRRGCYTNDNPRVDFYPRPPRGGRRETPSGWIPFWIRFLSTPSARRATCSGTLSLEPPGISIHALREEGDVNSPFHKAAKAIISIHALREEGDRMTYGWRPTAANFYPRPPRGGRLATALPKTITVVFLSTPSARRATT